MVNNASEPNVTQGLATRGISVLHVDGIFLTYCGKGKLQVEILAFIQQCTCLCQLIDAPYLFRLIFKK